MHQASQDREASQWTASLVGGRLYAVAGGGVEVACARRGQRLIPLLRRTPDGSPLAPAFDVAGDEQGEWDGSPRAAVAVDDDSFPRAAGGDELRPGDVVFNGEAPETVTHVESFSGHGWMVILRANAFALGQEESAVLLSRPGGAAPSLGGAGLLLAEEIRRTTGAG